MAYRVCLNDTAAVTADGRRGRRFNAAAYTGIAGDTRSFLIVSPSDLMAPPGLPLPASRATLPMAV